MQPVQEFVHRQDILERLGRMDQVILQGDPGPAASMSARASALRSPEGVRTALDVDKGLALIRRIIDDEEDPVERREG